MGFIGNFFRISEPVFKNLSEPEINKTYKNIRTATFWGVTISYCMYYACRLVLSIVKQPLIDDGVLTASQLGIIGSSFSFIYAFGKFTNGFIADYCNVKRFMAFGLSVSLILNLLLGIFGFIDSFFSPTMLVSIFFLIWGINGWVQSMGSPPGVVMLSRWFPRSIRGTYYSIICSTPYLGKFISMFIIGNVAVIAGWQAGFFAAALLGAFGVILILAFVKDTPESCGLPSIHSLSGEQREFKENTDIGHLQKQVFTHPGIWIIALSSAFVYMTQYGLSNWGILFLQKAKNFTLPEASGIIGFSEGFGVAGTVVAGWLSDRVFKGKRPLSVISAGTVCFISLCFILFSKGNAVENMLFVSIFSLSIGVLFCTIALMALDIVPRKAAGSSLGVIGIVSYAAVGLQDILSGFLIQDTMVKTSDNVISYNFMPVAVFWLGSCFLSFLLPLLLWKRFRNSGQK